eukprot:432716-Lingulodinium_polyedra.AAC.1
MRSHEVCFRNTSIFSSPAQHHMSNCTAPTALLLNVLVGALDACERVPGLPCQGNHLLEALDLAFFAPG